MRNILIAVAILASAIGGVTARAYAAPHRGDPPCSISPGTAAVGQAYTVSASGLPTDVTLNFWTSGPAGTTGMPLGTVASGAISYTTSSSVAGTWTYEVTGTNSAKVYSSCSIQVG